MNRNITLTVIIVVFFSTWFNSGPIYASLNKVPESYSKSVVASSNTIWVPDNYTTIQEAIDAASSGDTIQVSAETYNESITINKDNLTLIGENRENTIIDGGGADFVVYVIANNITLSGFTIQTGGLGIWFSRPINSILTGNIVSNNRDGIYVWGSSNNSFTGNIVSNNIYGIYVWGSSNNSFTGNIVSNNICGIYLGDSDNNVLLGNTAPNDQYGIYVDGSHYNTLSGNNVSSNNDSGIILHHSSNNIFLGNTASNNKYGTYIGDSDNNVLLGNTATNNQYGIHLYYSRDNVLTGNTATNNYCGIRLTSSSNYNALTGNNVSSNNDSGIRLISSSNNIIYHNNFIKNTRPASSIDSVNSWDSGAEGNYWSNYDGDDANWDGIGDTPYPIEANNRDNYPLMATFLQFTIVKENQSYKIDAVSSSRISNFQYHYNPDKKINAVSFEVNSAEGKGFCRISVAHALIEPPYTVTVDQNPPLYFQIVYTNGTHTWLYFTYDPLEQEVTLMQTPYPEQLVISQWAILGLSAIIVALLIINIHYYRMFKEQKKVVQAYERELGSFPVSHPERARARLIKDVIERREKIEKFKRKYGINIQPAGTLEDLMEKLGVKKES